MKNLLLVVFIVFGNVISYTQQQDPIKSYSGIPIITYGYDISIPPRLQFIEMEQAGILALEAASLTPPVFDDKIKNLGLWVLPEQVLNPENYIVKYTEARYTVWEAEGTDPQDGLITLYHDSINCVVHNGAVVTTLNTPNDTIIYGPMYSQEKTYGMVDPDVPINYKAVCSLKLEDIQPGQTLPGDTVCIIQVTTRTSYSGGSWQLGTPYSIIEKGVTYQELKPLNKFNEINLSYDLINIPAIYSQTNEIPYQTNRKFLANGDNSTQSFGRQSVHNIEFRVVWKGDSQKLKLSIEKFIVYDERGWSLFDPQSTVVTEINNQLDANKSAFNQQVAGWIGFDEPWDLDTWAPIKKVTEIIAGNSPNTSIWFQFNTKWNGRFDDYDNPSYSAKRIMIDEFMRRVKKANIWVTNWLYDRPCKDGETSGICAEGYKKVNINFADSIYRKIMEASKAYTNLHYGMSIQTGRYYDSTVYWDDGRIREISGSELLYQTNLALLYGAKLISPWLYFGEPPGSRDYTGFRNPPNYSVTDKYLMLKNTIAPRLRGLFGKTLKTLTPSTQHLNINPSVNANLELNNINRIKLSNSYSGEAQQTYLDLGFFDKQGYPSNSFFMIISRYYTNENIKDYKIDFRNLCNYKNWSLKNYIDGSVITVLADQNGFGVSPSFEIGRGDAILFSILPVVQYGGKLVYDETITNETLLDDMTIENGAILTVNGTYNAKANITLKAGGKIIAGTNGKIIFDAGKKLIIEGNAQVNGVALEFNPATSEGVLVKQSGNLTMSNCSIKNAQVGLRAENNGKVNLTALTIKNCTEAGILLTGSSDGANLVQKINYCTIDSCTIGISAALFNELVIKGNTITRSDLGINLNYIHSAHISNNQVLGKQAPQLSSLQGIYMQNSGGYLLGNTIKRHTYGVHLAYSSPDLGLNTIEDNIHCGLLAGAGSYPDLVQKLINPSCWSVIGGCNTIRNNGAAIFGSGPIIAQGDSVTGTEIFLSYGDVKLSYGGNEISDDRNNLDELLWLPLIIGTRSNDQSELRELMADRNFWGQLGANYTRFKRLNVVYEPIGDFCPVPYSPCYLNEEIISTADGMVVDTLPTKSRDYSEVSQLEELYANGDKMFLSGEVEQAKTYYEQIVSGMYSSEEKLRAYNRLYEIANILKSEAGYYTELQSSFADILSTETDTMLIKIYNQNSILCDVSKANYTTAITKFDNIIQQNPLSDEAVYAELDILTTSLLLDTTNTGSLGKLGTSGYIAKNSSDYLTKLSRALNKKFGNTKEEETLPPSSYTLYQNYPNPFNPVTTIKYDIPDVGTGLALSTVVLKIYDILGKEVATLVNEQQPAGRYQVAFDASNLASGVYIYKLQAGSFVGSKKMILLK